MEPAAIARGPSVRLDRAAASMEIGVFLLFLLLLSLSPPTQLY